MIEFNLVSACADRKRFKTGAAMAAGLAAMLSTAVLARTATASPNPSGGSEAHGDTACPEASASTTDVEMLGAFGENAMGFLADRGADLADGAARFGARQDAVIRSDGDDQVMNTDTLLVAADIDFGAGNDLFTNKGVVRFDKAATSQRLSFLGLERFANDGGLIDLRNGQAGDVLTLTGRYDATGNARLALDIDGATADSLVIGGVATGRTSITLQALSPEKAVLLDKDLTLVTAGAGSKADAFFLANADQGLVRYRLSFDDKAGTYLIDSSAGLAVHQSVRAVEGLRFAWRASAEAFDTEQAMARAGGGNRGRLWGVVHGVSIDRDADVAAFALDYEQTLTGGQMGASLGSRPLAGGEAAFGLMGGYADSSLTFEKNGQVIDMQTYNLGLYAAWRLDNLFATGLIKVDRHDVEIEDRAAGFTADLDGVSWGARVEAGYRLNLGAVALEPVVGLDYLSTSLDDLEALGQSVVFDERQGFSGRLGGQALSQYGLADGRNLVLSAGLELVHDFDTEQKGALYSNDLVDSVVMAGPETYGRTLVGVQLMMAGGLQTYIQGEGRFGDGQSGGGLRMGARYRF